MVGSSLDSDSRCSHPALEQCIERFKPSGLCLFLVQHVRAYISNEISKDTNPFKETADEMFGNTKL